MGKKNAKHLSFCFVHNFHLLPSSLANSLQGWSMHCCLLLELSPSSVWYSSLAVSHPNRNLRHFCSISSPHFRPVPLVYSARLSLNAQRSPPLSLTSAALSGWLFQSSPST